MNPLSRLFKRKPKETWYPNPFEEGERYRVTKTILGDFDKIIEGTELTYQSTGHSSYDGYIGFFFNDSEGNQRRWDIDESWDPIERFEGLFTKLTP
ncbi:MULTISPECIES: hypothetical protein [unclassified Lentimonas]|uniref:hypothetical protein n=1 Tax=unclassified Lentimonas TaxID=2630993 RepID=UPI0013212C5F|nr:MULTISPECIES: hypothetical protein [unclassified Lentimonas]CAA6696723.1 Unannotated [Lentimonas sp. CC10]CAA6697340.1 Unannotated [Lentimonas sp. CC19]CAA7072247.1 Unannotated [Lentimonas sp. CC11]